MPSWDAAAEVDRALAVLESGAPLPEEPRMHDFPDRVVPSEKAHRTWSAVKRIEARWNRYLCGSVPIDCVLCSKPFYREKVTQKRCRPCIEVAKRGSV